MPLYRPRGALYASLLMFLPIGRLFFSRRVLISAPVISKTVRMASSEGSGEYKYSWPRPSLTVDAVIVAKPSQEKPAQLLLIKRKNYPDQGKWALPGGFVEKDEPLYAAAARELQEETSVNPADVLLTQVGAFGDPGRDPRGWCVSVAYAALVPSTNLGVKAADDAADAAWFDATAPPQDLAFDHRLIIKSAFQHLIKLPEGQETEGLVGQLSAGIEKLA